jgi:hypothetical protein
MIMMMMGQGSLDNGCFCYWGDEWDDESLAFDYTSIGDGYGEGIAFVDCIEGVPCIERCWGYDLDVGRLL